MQMLEDDNIELKDSLESMRESLRKSRELFTEECKRMKDLECTLSKEHKRTRALEKELKRKEEDLTRTHSAFPCCTPHAEPETGPLSRHDNAALIEHMALATATTAVANEFQWQPDGVSISDWSDEEVASPRPALSKRRMCRGFSPLEPQKGLFDILEEVD